MNNPTLNILDFPAEIRRSILTQKNASKNIREHFKIRAVCRTLRDDVDHVDTRSHIDFIETHHEYQGIVRLQHACLDANNPTAVFMKAISDFMYSDARVNAFARIKHCAILGINPVIYCYEMIRLSISHELDAGSTIPPLSRSVIRALRRHIRKFQRLHWPIGIIVDLAIIRETVEQGRIVTCTCSVHWYWLDLLDENVKGYGMCHICFWTIEILPFFRVIPQTFLKLTEGFEWDDNMEDNDCWGDGDAQDAVDWFGDAQDCFGWFRLGGGHVHGNIPAGWGA